MLNVLPSFLFWWNLLNKLHHLILRFNKTIPRVNCIPCVIWKILSNVWTLSAFYFILWIHMYILLISLLNSVSTYIGSSRLIWCWAHLLITLRYSILIEQFYWFWSILNCWYGLGNFYLKKWSYGFDLLLYPTLHFSRDENWIDR